ncbi:MAG: TrmH family RNA methyltransferase [Candidatus Competibacterales bacterium]|nr:TrmH family RNA methyltransferase [Candidatus Competibacterales bacterium]
MTSAKKRRKRSPEAQAAWLFRRHRNANLLAEPGPHRLVMVLDHLKSDFNIGKIFRSADAFGAAEVHLVGIEAFDPAPAVGSFKWVPARFHADFEGCYRTLAGRGYRLFTLEPGAPLSLTRAELPLLSAFVAGHEERGLSFDRARYPDIQALGIPQFGRVQSLNVSVAASIVMYEYLRRHGPD